MKTLIALMLSVMTLGLVSACETIGGAGKDISSGGEAITDTAGEVKKEIVN